MTESEADRTSTSGSTPPVTDPRGVRLALISTFAAFVVLGLPEGIIGTAWPSVRDEFSRAESGLAVLLAGFTVGYTVSSTASGHLTGRFGTAKVLRIAIAVSALGVTGLIAAPGFEAMVAAYVVMGLGNGTIDSVANAWTALTHGARAMGLLHAAFGVGATAGPLLSAGLISTGVSWRWPFAVLIGGQAIALSAMWSAGGGFDDAPRHPAVEARASSAVSPPRRLLPLMLAWFTVYVGVEVGLGQWAFTLLTEERDMADGLAGILVASFWGGLTAGRLGLGAVGHLLRAERLMHAAMLLAIAASGLLWLDPFGLGPAALPVAGLAFAPMFPLMMNRTPVYLGPDRASRAVGYQLAASSLGFVTTPLLIGLLADQHGVGVTPPVVFGAVIALMALWTAVFRTADLALNPAES